MGDVKKFEGPIELRWKKGIKIYSFMWGGAIMVALNRENKNGQSYDIKKAKKIRENILEGTYPLQK